MEQYTKEDVRTALRAECWSAGSQAVWAKRHGFSRSYITDILKGRRDVTEKLAAALGLTRRVVFEKKGATDADAL